MTGSTADRLADHMAAELAEQFARRHAAAGDHRLAFINLVEAVTLYERCGCVEYAKAARQAARDELDQAPPFMLSAYAARVL